MTDETRQAIQNLIDFCSDKWVEADRDPIQAAELKTGRKLAYNDVLQHARRLLADRAG